jgi:DNA-binding beta-propeller fold protein YncE
MSHLFAFAIGLLKPRLDPQNRTTPIHRAADNKLLDLQVLRVIRSYIDTPFYFTSQDVEVEHRVIIADDVKIRYPFHLCELSDGCITVAESRDGGLIHIFRNNVLIQSIGSGIISRPLGVCTNSSNQLVVTDDIKHQVHMFARDGSHIRSFSGPGSSDGQLTYPYGVCVNSAGHILVADFNNHRISMFDNDGKFIRKFSSYGSNNDQLNGPISICVDNKDNVYVAEHYGHRVSKFLSNGNFLCTFGSKGAGPGQLSYPRGVCVTSDGKYIVVADTSNHRIQVLSGINGTFVASYGSPGSGIGQFYGASGCTITSDGCILVSDYHNHRIHEIRKR